MKVRQFPRRFTSRRKQKLITTVVLSVGLLGIASIIAPYLKEILDLQDVGNVRGSSVSVTSRLQNNICTLDLADFAANYKQNTAISCDRDIVVEEVSENGISYLKCEYNLRDLAAVAQVYKQTNLCQL